MKMKNANTKCIFQVKTECIDQQRSIRITQQHLLKMYVNLAYDFSNVDCL